MIHFLIFNHYCPQALQPSPPDKELLRFYLVLPAPFDEHLGRDDSRRKISFNCDIQRTFCKQTCKVKVFPDGVKHQFYLTCNFSRLLIIVKLNEK